MCVYVCTVIHTQNSQKNMYTRVLRPRVSSGQVCLEQNNHGAFISYISATYRSIREICVSDLFSAPVQPVGDVFTCEFVN